MSIPNYKTAFSESINLTLKKAAEILVPYPKSIPTFLRLGKRLKQAEKIREKLLLENVNVPQLLIISTTDECNLACVGCYACAHNRVKTEEIDTIRANEILDEATSLGVSVVMLAGGEPMLSTGWIDALGNHSDMVGIVFTNGTLLDDKRVAWFSEHQHMIPTFSLEGDEQKTDNRRGTGVFKSVENAIQKLNSANMPFGVSITVTTDNIDEVLSKEFTQEYINKGCRVFFYVEYVPIDPHTRPLVLSGDDKQRLSAFCKNSTKTQPSLFIPFPGDEEQFEGCLAAGRGFVHISSSGNVEPCPFAPFSDTNLKNTSLKDALASSFLAKVRENHHLLKEGEGGCALWNNRDFLDELMTAEK